jgi:hypothetical protein
VSDHYRIPKAVQHAQAQRKLAAESLAETPAALVEAAVVPHSQPFFKIPAGAAEGRPRLEPFFPPRDRRFYDVFHFIAPDRGMPGANASLQLPMNRVWFR